MKVSVVVTVFDLARYVEETVRSALEQSHHDIEVIVVDDASRDGSAELVARTFGDRVQLVRNPRNLNVLRSTLVGLERAQGEVVCFLDGDDLWHPHKVERVVEVFDARPDVVLVSHDYKFIDGAGRVVLERDSTQEVPRRLLAAGDHAGLSQAMAASILEYRGHVWLGSAWSIRRSAIAPAQLAQWVASLPSPEGMYQDHPLATLLLLTSRGALSYVDQPLLSYRVHDANYSGAARDATRAQAIVNKGRATRQATLELLRAHAVDRPDRIALQELKVREYDFLDAVYRRDVTAALDLWLALTRTVWTPSRAAKEAARLLAVAAQGPDAFLHNAQRARRVRAMLRDAMSGLRPSKGGTT